MSDEVVLPLAGWYTDPSDESRIRYWDGAAWTDHVAAAQVDAQPQEDAQSDTDTDVQEVMSDESATINHVEPEEVVEPSIATGQTRTPRDATVAMFFGATFAITALVALVALITSN